MQKYLISSKYQNYSPAICKNCNFIRNFVSMIKLSILIPTYNDECLSMVRSLHSQCEAAGADYEIIVADDGSNDDQTRQINAQVGRMEHCKYCRRDKNMGRSAIRNWLAEQAKGMWLLFIDASTTIPEGFVSRYLAHIGAADVVVGGVAVRDGGNKTSLRWRYEHAKMKKNKASERNKHPYKSFRTTNFMVKKSVMLSHSLPMNVAGYGYEDVLWGKALAQDGVTVRHIDNPVYYDELESNTRYLQKLEESMRTLLIHNAELQGYSPLLSMATRLKKLGLMPAISGLYTLLGPALRTLLLNHQPPINVLQLYKLLYYCHLSKQKRVSTSA